MLFRSDLVERRKWISEEEYKEGLALAQLAPGPLAAQLGIYLGFVHYGVIGATIAGFPGRIVGLYPLEVSGAPRFKTLADEWAADLDSSSGAGSRPTFAQDPRIDWLVDLLHQVAPAKVLVLCRSEAKAVALEAALRGVVALHANDGLYSGSFTFFPEIKCAKKIPMVSHCHSWLFELSYFVE